MLDHEPIVFAPATDQITIRCKCGQPPEGMKEGEYTAHVVASLRAARAEPGLPSLDALADAVAEALPVPTMLDVDFAENTARDILAALEAHGEPQEGKRQRKPNAYGLTGRMRDVRGLPDDGISGKPLRRKRPQAPEVGR